MKKLCLFTLYLLTISYFSLGYNPDIFEKFSSKHVNKNIKHDTLLIVKYEKLSIDNPIFSNMKLSKKVLVEFIESENKKIDKYNEGLTKMFHKNYGYNFLIIDNKELKNYSSEEYPYVYKRYIDYQNQELVYLRYFMNRKEKIIYNDIYLFSKTTRGKSLVEKDIILALHDFID